MRIAESVTLHNVRRLIKSRGYNVNFTRTLSGGSYDVVTGSVSGATVDTEKAFGLFADKNMARALDGSIVTENRVFMMLPDNVVKIPQDGDELTKDGATDKIGSVKTIKSGDSPALYICEVAS